MAAIHPQPQEFASGWLAGGWLAGGWLAGGWLAVFCAARRATRVVGAPGASGVVGVAMLFGLSVFGLTWERYRALGQIFVLYYIKCGYFVK
jgi:hypothetical protein